MVFTRARMQYREIQKKKSVNGTFHNSRLSLDPLKLPKNVNKSGLKISTQISVTVRFAREIKLVSSKYVNIMRI